MDALCTLCLKPLHEEEGSAASGPFGLCADCRLSFSLKRKDPGPHTGLESISDPVLLFDQEARLVACNRSAELAFGGDQNALMALQPGEVLGCERAKADGCGHSAECARCSLRQAILYSLSNGRDHERLPVILPVQREGRSMMRCMSVSTRRIGQAVRVQLEEDGYLPAP